MQLIYLNTWCGQVEEPMVKFLEREAAGTDVFCFQEADARMQELAAAPLRGFHASAARKYISDDDAFCQATYVRNSAAILQSATLLDSGNDVGFALSLQVSSGNGSVHICNLHGVSQPGDKLDSPGRLRQSRELGDFFEHKAGPKIIGGDFNLLPQTRSIEMFEEKGYRNLIKEFRIATTRNRLAWEMYPDNKQHFCDYVFVSPEVQVKSFSVPNLEISDHLPMIVEVED